MSDLIDEVILGYRRNVVKYFRREPRRPFLRNAEDRVIARKIVAWAEKNAVDPVAFLDTRCDQFWRARKRLPGFRQIAAPCLLTYARQEESSTAASQTQSESFVQAVRDLTRLLPGHEQVRRRYYFEQRQGLCLENPLNGGYDPRSYYCPNCPQAPACAGRLNEKWRFDVVSLRSGKIEAVPEAVRKALRGWDGGLSV